MTAPLPSASAALSLPVAWSLREPPLPPGACAFGGRLAGAAVAQLRRRSEEDLARLRAVATRNLFVVLGDEDDLPWLDGVEYLGVAPDAPLLLLPTTQAPTVPSPLLLARLQALRGGRRIAVLPSAGLVLSVDGAAPLSRAALASWQGAP